jgi:hypothetical protein
MFDMLQAAGQARASSRSIKLPAPVRGLIKSENIAMSKPAGAFVLENWFPTSTGIVTRRGKTKFATLSAGPVRAMMTFVAGTTAKLFAANNAGIYDATTPASPTTALTAASGIGTVTNGDFSSVQFSAGGGDYLFCVNRENLHKTFNGTSWAENSPAITGVTSNNFSHVWSFANRLFFVRKDSLKFCYLPVSSIGGVATSYDLGTVFSQGGYLLSGGTWSSDAGNDTQDLCIFITSEGEIAAFAGTDPSDPANWSLQGVYRVGKPMGKNAMFRAGGDIAIATRDGLVPMSGAYMQAREALRDTAVSKGIEELWIDLTSDRNTLPWKIQTFTDQHSMLWVAPPTIAGQTPVVLVANMRTGAWTTFTGYDVRSMASIGNLLFVGDPNGIIYQAETGGTDDGATYTARAAGLWDDLRVPLAQKRTTMIKGMFRANVPSFNPRWSVGTDYNNSFGADPSSPANVATSLWGSSTWGAATWGGPRSEYRTSEWAGIDGIGEVISWQLQVTLGSITPPDIELASIGILFEVGEMLA